MENEMPDRPNNFRSEFEMIHVPCVFGHAPFPFVFVRGLSSLFDGNRHFCFLTYVNYFLVCPPLAPSPPRPSLRPPLVTMQIYLSCSAKRTDASGSPVASAPVARSAARPRRHQIPDSSKARMATKSSAAKARTVRKTPSFSLQLRKSGSLSTHSPLDTPTYHSPVKSSSQYFQICY